MGKPPLDFADDAIEALEAYRWPGNVRELSNLMSRLCLLASTPLVRLQDLPQDMRGEPANALGLRRVREGRSGPSAEPRTAEREAVMEALSAERGNLSKVAQRLGISRPTLYRKIAQYGIQAQRSFS